MIRICEIDIMFIKIYRNPKTRNWFRYETFIHLFEFKGFSTWGERETQSFYADYFYIVSQRAVPVAHKFVWPRPALNLDSLVRRQELNSLLFLKSPNPQPTLPVRYVTNIPWSQFLSGIFILTSLNDTSSLRAWTPALMFAPN